mmetsp:Transcript_153989/g.492297  ORF Transcript_153989/g.492297 Transcript_153989/m.492297 type:complete len:248 (+) Transcript_153989:349-1092(+)
MSTKVPLRISPSSTKVSFSPLASVRWPQIWVDGMWPKSIGIKFMLKMYDWQYIWMLCSSPAFTFGLRTTMTFWNPLQAAMHKSMLPNLKSLAVLWSCTLSTNCAPKTTSQSATTWMKAKSGCTRHTCQMQRRSLNMFADVGTCGGVRHLMQKKARNCIKLTGSTGSLSRRFNFTPPPTKERKTLGIFQKLAASTQVCTSPQRGPSSGSSTPSSPATAKQGTPSTRVAVSQERWLGQPLPVSLLPGWR